MNEKESENEIVKEKARLIYSILSVITNSQKSNLSITWVNQAIRDLDVMLVLLEEMFNSKGESIFNLNLGDFNNNQVAIDQFKNKVNELKVEMQNPPEGKVPQDYLSILQFYLHHFLMNWDLEIKDIDENTKK